MNNIVSFHKELLTPGQKIVIYGAGRYGELALRGLETLGLKPVCFMDKNNYGKEYLGYEVVNPLNIANYSNAAFLVASLNYFGEIVRFLHDHNIRDVYNIITLMELEYDESVLSEYALDEKNCIDKYVNVVNHFATGFLALNHVEVVVTERCSLRCKDCANLIQYYSEPQSFCAKDIVNSIKSLLGSVTEILDMRLLGGEPFLNMELDQVIDYLVQSDQIKRISIYTNATVVPNERTLAKMNNSKVFVHISNYGIVSRKLAELRDVFETIGIRYYIHNYEEWYDLGKPDKHEYSQMEVDRLFGKCIMAKCYTLFNGVLYSCPRAAHGERLGFFKNDELEIVDVFETNSKEKIQMMLERKQALTACFYCNGSSNDGTNKIKSAIQKNKADI